MNVPDININFENNNIRSNIVKNEKYKTIAGQTLNAIADSISKSLGYYGSSTIIEDKINGHVITKDGYTILKGMKFENPISETIYDIIKKISYNLVQTVGDGSTSSIVIASKLFNYLENEKYNKYSPKEIFDSLQFIENFLVKKIEKYATPINDDNFEKIKNIAEVSNNNDSKVGENIYNIYKKIKDKGFIYVENSDTNEDKYEFINGIEFASGMISEKFSTNKNKPECIFKEPFIFMCNDRLDSTDLNYMVDTIGNLVSRHTRPVVIISKSFSAEFVSCWEINKMQNPNLQICLIDFNFANQNQEEIFKDIAIYTGSKIFDKSILTDEDCKNNIFKWLGTCDEVIITNKTTKIIGMNGDQKELDERVAFINETIENLKKMDDGENYEFRIFQLQKRLGNLTSSIVRYFVGGNSELEKNTRKYLIEDSIHACKAAIETGYVSGGNLTVPKIIKKINISKLNSNSHNEKLMKILLEDVFNSFVNCYECVLDNKNIDIKEKKNILIDCLKNNQIYNLKTEKMENDSETNIINSALTEIEILKATFSIIGLLVTSNQYLGKTIL